jgi:hypothetical protein
LDYFLVNSNLFFKKNRLMFFNYFHFDEIKRSSNSQKSDLLTWNISPEMLVMPNPNIDFMSKRNEEAASKRSQSFSFLNYQRD